MLLEKLRSRLADLDDSDAATSESDVYSAICELVSNGDKSWKSSLEYRAEKVAFAFDEGDGRKTDLNYGVFAPMMSGITEGGTPWEWPSIQSIDKGVLDYWVERAKASRHPVLRARYAGLVWEFTPRVTGLSAGITVAQICIDAVVEMAMHVRHERDVDVCRKLGYVLRIAISIADEHRVEQVRDRVIEYVQRVGDDDKPELWGRAFDLLYSNKRVPLTDDLRNALIQNVEDRLGRISDPAVAGRKLNPWASQAAAKRLATHYRKEGRQEDIRRVLMKVERAFDCLAENASPMLAQAWCEQVEQLYCEFGLIKEASRIRRRIRELGPGAYSCLAEHSHMMEIEKDDMDACANAILTGSLDDARRRFASLLLPRRKETEKQLQELAQSSPLAYMVNQRIIDRKGRAVAAIGPLENDLNGHVIAQTAMHIRVMYPWLRCVIEEMIKRYNVDATKVLAWTEGSPLFDEAKREIVRRGLDAYFAHDALLAIHLLVPQVEDAIRQLVELAGGDVYRPNRQGGMDLRTFDDLLRDPLIIAVLRTDVIEYLRAFYTDRRGINLRNDICHGMIPSEDFDIGSADRVFHTLVLLTLVRTKDDTAPSAENDIAS